MLHMGGERPQRQTSGKAEAIKPGLIAALDIEAVGRYRRQVERPDIHERLRPRQVERAAGRGDAAEAEVDDLLGPECRDDAPSP